MKKKAFDCVAMKHEGAAKVQAETRHLTLAQQVAYWRERTEALRRFQETRSGQPASVRDTTPS